MRKSGADVDPKRVRAFTDVPRAEGETIGGLTAHGGKDSGKTFGDLRLAAQSVGLLSQLKLFFGGLSANKDGALAADLLRVL